ncbi:bifunctional hydroxymethylpyrimidine kinase/phosphomethylpyrimidine kinase [Streptococcaceae bacterium ESL0687]|nr:bifunctional hydroxymethylpyrimidine kinase/phosphomethylpyrimidine kinase [Streptococcaceae bacterium ESL0687]
MKKVLTIAGSDSTGGAGIQADLKTFEEYGLFGISSITSVVTMDYDNSWKHKVTDLGSDLLANQLKSALAGNKISAVKTGMMASYENARVASEFIDQYACEKLLVDPVIACKGTAQILQPESLEGLKEYLLPRALITTPNLIEAGILSGLGDLKTASDMREAAKRITDLGPSQVLVKGGHRLGIDKALDIYYDGSDFYELEGELYQTDFNHGAGCTLAAAITAGMAKDMKMLDALLLAKSFVAAAIEDGIEINKYLGHVWHGAYNHAEKRIKG